MPQFTLHTLKNQQSEKLVALLRLQSKDKQNRRIDGADTLNAALERVENVLMQLGSAEELSKPHRSTKK